MRQRFSIKRKFKITILIVFAFVAIFSMVFSYYSTSNGPLQMMNHVGNTLTSAGQGSSVVGNEALYQMVFEENGLPLHSLLGTYGTEWSVKVINNATGSSMVEYSSNTTISFWVPNGTYRYYVQNFTLYGYRVVPESGIINMIGKNYLSLITFNFDYYTLLFKEKNLPSSGSVNTEWYVKVSNSTGFSLTQYSQNSTVSFVLPAGTYSYNLGDITDFSTTNESGTVDLTSSQTVYENFTNSIPASSSTSGYIVFEEKGLPYNTTWSVILTNQSKGSSGTTYSTSYRDLIIHVYGSETFYSVEIDGQYFANPDNGVLTVDSNVVVQNISFESQYHYVNVSESGLPSGMKWSIALRNSYDISTVSSGNGSISFFVPNGTYEYRVINDVGFHPQNNIGVIYVNGTNFSNLTISFVDSYYSVSFNETNLPLSLLPAGTEWSVSALFISSAYYNSSSSSNIGFSLPNGTYEFTVYTVDHYIPTPSKGIILVNGSSVLITVSFTIYKYPVSFASSGLPFGDQWFINITSSTGAAYSINGTATTLSISLVNGTYSYNVQSENKTSTPVVSSGIFTVNGNVVNESVSFVRVYYTVTIHESGLPVTNGTTERWEILVDGSYYNMTNQNLTLQFTNGTYSYTVFNTASYNTTTPSGTFTVHGSSMVVNVKYAPVQHITKVSPHKPVTVPISGVILYILIGIGAVGLIVLFAVYTKGRR